MADCFGLDFGTSNSSLSFSQDGKVRLLDIDKGSPVRTSLKSVLYFYKDDKKISSYVGFDAVQEYIENGAVGRYLQSIKTFLPDKSFEKTDIYNKDYQLEELISLILRTIKNRGESIIGTDVTDVALGRPVLFSNDPEKDKLAEKRLVRAAELAGFKNISLQLEPIAAAYTFESRLAANEEKNVLVADFGGGTSDFTILKANRQNLKKKDRFDDILGVAGVYIGGDLFDSDIMWNKVCKYYGKEVKAKSMMSENYFGLSTMITAMLKRWHLIPHLNTEQTIKYIEEFKFLANSRDKKFIRNLENLIHLNYGLMLFQAIEKAKIELSEREQSAISFDDYEIKINEAIQKNEFNAYIRDKAHEIDAVVEKLLIDANIKNSDIDVVFLTGGSSYVPLIKNIFLNRFGGDKIKQSDAFTSVAYGLGIYSSSL